MNAAPAVPAFHQETETDVHAACRAATGAFREECLSSLARIQYLKRGGSTDIHDSVLTSPLDRHPE